MEKMKTAVALVVFVVASIGLVHGQDPGDGNHGQSGAL